MGREKKKKKENFLELFLNCVVFEQFEGLGVILDCKEIEQKEVLFWQDDQRHTSPLFTHIHFFFPQIQSRTGCLPSAFYRSRRKKHSFKEAFSCFFKYSPCPYLTLNSKGN